MPESFLLGRLLLQFNSEAADIITDLSAVALTPEGHLWLGSDETTSIERLSPVGLMFLENIKDLRSPILSIFPNKLVKSILKELISTAIIFGLWLLTAPNARKLKAKTRIKTFKI
jgi:hypothetical protein